MFNLRILAAFSLIISCYNSASAGMIITSASRSLSAGSNSALNSTTGVFNQTINSPTMMATSSQNTNITTSSLSGFGNVFRIVPNADTAYSGLFVEFDLLQTHTFTLSSNLSSFTPGTAALSLMANTGTITPGGSPVVASTGAFSTSGILGPGSYSFVAVADMVIPFVSTGSANYEFDFQVEPVAAVPEPSSMFLAALGILGLPVVRRKRR